MRFNGRDLKPYLETVEPDNLIEGQEYFSISYVDEERLLPIIDSLVYVGKNLETEDKNVYYFQDLVSYSAGIRYNSSYHGEQAEFHTGDIINSIQNYEQALNELLRCSLLRKRKQK